MPVSPATRAGYRVLEPSIVWRGDPFYRHSTQGGEFGEL